MSFLGVVVENIVDYLGSGKGYAVPGLRFNGAPVVDCGSPEVHQYGGRSVRCPEAQTNGAGTGVLHIENQLAQGDFPGAPRRRQIYVIDFGARAEVGGNHVGPAAVEAHTVSGGGTLLHRDGGRGAGSADVTLDAGTSRRSGWPLGQHKVQRHAGVGGGGGDSGGRARGYIPHRDGWGGSGQPSRPGDALDALGASRSSRPGDTLAALRSSWPGDALDALRSSRPGDTLAALRSSRSRQRATFAGKKLKEWLGFSICRIQHVISVMSKFKSIQRRFFKYFPNYRISISYRKTSEGVAFRNKSLYLL